MGLSQQESKQEVKNIFPHPFGNDGISTSLSVHLIYVICSITFSLSPSSNPPVHVCVSGRRIYFKGLLIDNLDNYSSIIN